MQSITIRIPDELKDLIAEESQKSGLTQSDFLRRIIETYAGQVDGEDLSQKPGREMVLNPVERHSLVLSHYLLLASRGDLPDELYDAEIFSNDAEALLRGYSGEYPRIFAGFDEEISYAECRLVWDILDMFRVIESCVRDLGEDGWEKTGVVNAQHFGSYQGFDFQIDIESRLAGYVDYLVRTHRWEEQKVITNNGGGNSHTEMLPTYRAMLSKFKPAWRKAVSPGLKRELNLEDIQNILLAAPGARLMKDEA